MSSHREAPEIAKDPVADSTDVYAFVSPDAPDTVTLIANFIPLQLPNGGPNFYEFGDDVLYTIHVSNQGTGTSDIEYQFRFTTTVKTPGSFLYNTGPLASNTDANFNRSQTFTCTRVVTATGASTVLFTNKPVPPCNVGVRSTPKYHANFAVPAVYTKQVGQSVTKVFCGQRAEAFYVDLGSIFDLGTLRPFQAYTAFMAPSGSSHNKAENGVNGTQQLNVHTIAMQIPKKDLSRVGYAPTDPSKPEAVIGVYSSASRQTARSFDSSTGKFTPTGPFQQVSRLAMPLVNEVLTPLGQKDLWNTQAPANESQYVANYAHPELAGLLPVLYPGVFPNLAMYNAGTYKDASGATLPNTREDIKAIFLTGIPSGIIAGFQNYTGTTQAEMIRLNMAIAPKKPTDSGFSTMGLLGGDLAGFPNGRRIQDNVVQVELIALAGGTIPLTQPTYKADSNASALTDGTTNTNGAIQAAFPYLADPLSGYEFTPGPVTVPS